MTVAGSDPSGGAGLQADLKTFHQHGVYGTSVVTLLTVQNSQNIHTVEVLNPEFVLWQLEAVLDDIPPTAAKTGALGNAAVIESMARRAALFSFPLVIDPIMISKQGAPLIDNEGMGVLRHKLIPQAFLVTPNLSEASWLAEMDVTDLLTMRKAATSIAKLGAKNVLVKGGHLSGPSVDILWSGGQHHTLPSERIDTAHTHGTGCVLSAAITARLAQGQDLVFAVKAAKKFITTAIQNSPGLGRGHGPIDLHSKINY